MASQGIWNKTARTGATLALLLLSGCGYFYDPTVWVKDLRSPDGAWTATATTRQWGGFGSAWVETTVSIQKIDKTVNKGKPFDVFSYPGGGQIPKTYVLSPENADADLQVTWLTPNHLQIGHKSPVKADLAVIRFANVDVTFKPGMF